jgi:glutathione S-transferase
MSAFYGPQLKLNMEFIETELGKSTWFAGEELTGAGIYFFITVLIIRYNDELSCAACLG